MSASGSKQGGGVPVAKAARGARKLDAFESPAPPAAKVPKQASEDVRKPEAFETQSLESPAPHAAKMPEARSEDVRKPEAFESPPAANVSEPSSEDVVPNKMVRYHPCAFSAPCDHLCAVASAPRARSLTPVRSRPTPAPCPYAPPGRRGVRAARAFSVTRALTSHPCAKRQFRACAVFRLTGDGM
jgi:hypothetical protein